IKKELGKMLRDGKNSDYYDQIYYALEEVYFREGEQDMGIELLKKSVASSRSNTNQKGLSFLKLADVHFNNEPPAYQLAQAYYDSAVTFIDKARPDFNDILNKRNSLSRLVRDLTTIQMEDSLQMLASMSEKELDDLIDGIIQQVIEEEEKMQEEQENNYLFANENSYNNQNAGSGANWYFYNPATIGFGFSEFKRIWGDRKLEDNWRRKDKSSVITQELDEFYEFENAEEDTLEGAKDNKNKNYYLKNIPLTEEKMLRSHNKIIEAYYDLGLVYKERLNDNYMAVESFKELVRRYDTCRYALSSYYQLYRLYLADDNQEEADYYKRLILTKAPGSEYAQLIKNPNYFLEKQKSKTNLLDFYKNTYSAFSDKQWTSALNQCVASDSLYPQSRLAPKFHLLKALTLGKISGKDTLVMELKKVIALHPDREEAREAKRILNILNRKKPKNGKTPKPGKKAEYKLNPKAKHLFLLIFPNTLTKASELKKQISDFNKEYFRLQNFQVASMFLVNGKTQLITVREFPGKAKAVNYYKTFSANCKVMKSSNSDSFSLFIISTDNFSIFYRDKNVKTYDAFFKKNYLDNQ
ncbi:MAG: tol-pal system YbgF family protein, partial [Flavobacteriales bacterium]